jgi:hypothetical protein
MMPTNCDNDVGKAKFPEKIAMKRSRLFVYKSVKLFMLQVLEMIPELSGILLKLFPELRVPGFASISKTDGNCFQYTTWTF